MLKKKWLIFGLAGLCIFSFCLYSFASEVVRHGNVIEVEPGKVFVIVLDSSRANGFKWELARPLDKKKIEFVSSTYKGISGGHKGSLGEDILVFKALEAGKTTIYLKYAGPKEKSKPPAKKKNFVIIVKKIQYNSESSSL